MNRSVDQESSHGRRSFMRAAAGATFGVLAANGLAKGAEGVTVKESSTFDAIENDPEGFIASRGLSVSPRNLLSALRSARACRDEAAARLSRDSVAPERAADVVRETAIEHFGEVVTIVQPFGMQFQEKMAWSEASETLPVTRRATVTVTGEGGSPDVDVDYEIDF